MAPTIAVLATLPSVAAFHATAGLRPATRSTSVNMVELPSIALPDVAFPSIALPTVALPDLGSLIQAVPTEAFLAVPVVGAIGAGALLFAPSEPIEASMGTAFTSDTVTPAMALALADKKKKASLKYKFVDPVLNVLDDGLDGVKERFAEIEDKVETAKAEAAKAKKDKAEAAERLKGIEEGKLIPLQLPLGIRGVVVPNPLAAAKDLLPVEEPVEEKKGLKLPF